MSDTPPKKPSSGAENDHWYLEDQVSGLLSQVNAESDREKRWELLKRLRERTSDLLRNRNAGYSSWAPVSFALIVVAIFVAILFANSPPGYVYSAPKTYVRVLEEKSPYDFVFQFIVDGKALTTTHMHFCEDYRPRMEAGHTLTYLSYDDRGNCVSVAPADRGYDFLYDQNNCPVVPANCRHTNCSDHKNDHIQCAGKPQFN